MSRFFAIFKIFDLLKHIFLLLINIIDFSWNCNFISSIFTHQCHIYILAFKLLVLFLTHLKLYFTFILRNKNNFFCLKFKYNLSFYFLYFIFIFLVNLWILFVLLIISSLRLDLSIWQVYLQIWFRIVK